MNKNKIAPSFLIVIFLVGIAISAIPTVEARGGLTKTFRTAATGAKVPLALRNYKIAYTNQISAGSFARSTNTASSAYKSGAGAGSMARLNTTTQTAGIGQGTFATIASITSKPVSTLPRSAAGINVPKPAVQRLSNSTKEVKNKLASAKPTVPINKSLGQNPFQGKTPEQLNNIFVNKGFKPMGKNPIKGQGTYLNPKTGRSYHIDAAHPLPKGPHVGVQRPREKRALDIKKVRDYKL